MDQATSEFELIEQIWAPLSRGEKGAFGLKDDVAQLPPSTVGHLVTCDQVIEHTHFLPSDPLHKVGQRLLRRNLSDLIAKGARPIGAFLTLAWPNHRPKADMAAFAAGLGEDLTNLCGGCPLLGGDTSRTQGPLIASLTLIGEPLTVSGLPVLRSGAMPGDVVVVTGTIGDPYLGLQVRLGNLDKHGLETAIQKAFAPAPPNFEFARLVAAFAHASIDISDGLLADAGHVAAASDLLIRLDLDQVPLSLEARAWLLNAETRVDGLLQLVTGGDEYQTLICLAEDQVQAFTEAALELGEQPVMIGRCLSGKGLMLKHRSEVVPTPLDLGWKI